MKPIKLHHLDFDAVLDIAELLLIASAYQSKFIAGRYETDEYGFKTLVACSPFHKDAALSLRGALTVACGSGPKAWPIFEFMHKFGLLSRDDPRSRQDALRVIAAARNLMSGRKTAA